MPWYLTVTTAGKVPLGTRDDVVAVLSTALSGISWSEGPSSFDELRGIPNNPLLQLPWTAEQQAVFSLPKLTGTYDGGAFTLRVTGLESCPLTSFPVEVRGDGDPLPALRQVC